MSATGTYKVVSNDIRCVLVAGDLHVILETVQRISPECQTAVIASYLQWANMPFRPLREKLAEKPVLYGVLSLLKRTWKASGVSRDVCQRYRSELMTHVAVYSVDDIFRRQVRDLRVDFYECIRKVLYESLPLFLG